MKKKIQMKENEHLKNLKMIQYEKVRFIKVNDSS